MTTKTKQKEKLFLKKGEKYYPEYVFILWLSFRLFVRLSLCLSVNIYSKTQQDITASYFAHKNNNETL